MKIIKECHKGIRRHQCVIRTNTYGNTIDFFNRLAREAKNDFTHLSDESLTMVHFGWPRYARTYGILFDVPGDETIPNEYVEVAKWDVVL